MCPRARRARERAVRAALTSHRGSEGFVGQMGAGHFIYIPATVFIGMVIGWILGSRAARDAFAVELKRREERSARR